MSPRSPSVARLPPLRAASRGSRARGRALPHASARHAARGGGAGVPFTAVLESPQRALQRASKIVRKRYFGMSLTQLPPASSDPQVRTVDYGLAPGALDENIDVESEEMLVNMGPQHPSTHGVLRVVLRTDGEMVLEAVPHLGYLHRCKEKIAENLAYYQYIGYTDRLDYLAAMNNNHAWSMAVEQLAGIEVPERAEYIRVIAVELNRIASHLVSFGTYGLDMGAFTPFLYAFREREYILDLFEQLCGARLTLSYINVGGVTWDLPPLFLEKLSEFLDYFEPKIDEYNDLLSFNHIFIKRTANVGVVTKKLAIDYALSGPMI